MTIDFYVEIVSLVFGLLGLIYVFGGIKLADHKLYIGWRLIFVAYIFFILDRLGRLLEYANILNLTDYKSISGALFIVFATLGVIYFNKEITRVLKRKK